MASSYSLAQSRTSSPYSFFGLGQETFKGTIENRSMGSMLTYADSVHINLRNPAAYGRLRLTTYTIGGVHTETWASTENDNDTYDATTIEYVSIGIPVGRRTAFGFGLIPFNSVGYEIGNISPTNYTRFTGEGSINRAYFSLGYQLLDALSLGAEFRYNFGEETNSSSVAINTVQFGTNETNETDFSGVSYNFGLHFQKMISDDMELQASAVYSPESDLNAKSERNLSSFFLRQDLTESIVNTQVTETSNEDVKLPSELTLGIGLGKPLKWNIGLEYVQKGSSSLTDRTFVPQNATFTDANIIRAGGFYIPNYNSITSYWDRVVYRGGVRYEELGLELRGENITEFGISFGLGLPVGRSNAFSNANIGFEYGQRGTTDAGLIKEDFFSISIGLSLNDRWFQKRKYN